MFSAHIHVSWTRTINAWTVCVSVYLRTRMNVGDIVQWAPSWILRPGRPAPSTASPGSCRRLSRRWPGTRHWRGRARCGPGGAPANLRQGLFNTGAHWGLPGPQRRKGNRVSHKYPHTLGGWYIRAYMYLGTYMQYTHMYGGSNHVSDNNDKIVTIILSTFVKIKLA